MIAALAVTPRLRPGVAGAVWLAATLFIVPVRAPAPEQRAFVLTAELGKLTMSAGTGGEYVVDLDVENNEALAEDEPLAVLRFAGNDHVILAGSSDHSTVWRPHGLGAGTRWRASARSRFAVPEGERPVLFRHPELSGEVKLRVETIGAVRATPPRDWMLPSWLLAAAAVVAVIEIASGTWRSSVGLLPWLLLVLGSLVARSSVEPLRLLGERLAVDLAMAAFLAAWLPAARVWLRRRRVFVTLAAVLVPLALATPHLTPSLYGDEPFHLVVMESLAGDGTSTSRDDLDLDLHPQNQLYAPGRPLFHSPALGLILLPGYVVAGRAGALVLLALMGAALAVLVARRSRDLGLHEASVGVLVLVLAMTYPLATFSTQIWPELPGALAVAALLVLAARSRGGRWLALAVAVVAAAIKTRLGLLTLPIAAAAWLRRRPLRGLVVLVLASGAVLAVGWLTMGHPFGPYRRLHHLVPTDPGAGRTGCRWARLRRRRRSRVHGAVARRSSGRRWRCCGGEAGRVSVQCSSDVDSPSRPCCIPPSGTAAAHHRRAIWCRCCRHSLSRADWCLLVRSGGGDCCRCCYRRRSSPGGFWSRDPICPSTRVMAAIGWPTPCLVDLPPMVAASSPHSW